MSGKICRKELERERERKEGARGIMKLRDLKFAKHHFVRPIVVRT